MKAPKVKPVKSKTGKTTATSTMRGRGRSVVRKTGTLHPLHTPKGHVTGSGTLTGPKKTPVKAKTPVKRKWSPGSDVACCSAEALGFLLGWSPEQVLGLYWATCSDADEGASILDTLSAAQIQAFGLNLEFGSGLFKFSCILGVTLPEPHAVAVTPDGTWHSWGEPFNPFTWPELAVDEAWAVLL